jgi:hypothetical protein
LVGEWDTGNGVGSGKEVEEQPAENKKNVMLSLSKHLARIVEPKIGGANNWVTIAVKRP